MRFVIVAAIFLGQVSPALAGLMSFYDTNKDPTCSNSPTKMVSFTNGGCIADSLFRDDFLVISRKFTCNTTTLEWQSDSYRNYQCIGAAWYTSRGQGTACASFVLDCAKESDLCKSVSCGVHGTCSATSGMCTCKDNFSGPTCKIEPPPPVTFPVTLYSDDKCSSSGLSVPILSLVEDTACMSVQIAGQTSIFAHLGILRTPFN